MPTDHSTRLLEAFAEITAAAPRPAPAAQRAPMRSGLPVGTLAGAVAIVAVVALAGLFVGRPGPSPDPGGLPSPTSLASTPVAVATVSPAPTVLVTPSPTPTAIVTPEPTVGPCDPTNLAARITSWEGAAGSRIASVSLVNGGPVACLFEAKNHPQLIDGGGVLIDGRNPATTPVLTFEPGATVTTFVSAANYCGAPPVPPVSVAFILGDGQRIVAAPADASDEAVPPCNGPGQPGTIEMHPWAR